MNKKEHNNKTAIIIAGPTAVGKTKLAIEVAQYFNTEIISADSRQCYREMTIGTAVPSSEELNIIPHHFIHSHSITEPFNAGMYEQWAVNKALKLFEEKDIIIVCGGTGLYIKAFCDGIDDMPSPSMDLQNEILKNHQQKGLPWLQQQLQKKDPKGYPSMEQQNPQRLMRALAVVETTGKSIKTFQTETTKKRPFNVLKIGLTLPREQLQENITNRCKEMIASGLVEEAEKLYPYRQLNALQTVGYKEMFDYIAHSISLPEALEKIIVHTRQYAKRQMTWFRKDNKIKWFSPHSKDGIITYIEEQINLS